MKLFKKNQVIIYVIVLMLMTAGYLNYTNNTKNQAAVETSMQMESADDMQLADIGDATLVSSNELVTENTQENQNATKEENLLDANTTNENQTIINTNTNAEESKTNQSIETRQTNSNSSSNDYFTKSKLERETMYSQILETYEKVLNSTNSLEINKQTATQEIQKINDTKNSIMISENLIRTKGFENSVIFVNGDSVSVIVGAQEIKPEEVAQIQNIIARELKTDIQNIHIATK